MTVDHADLVDGPGPLLPGRVAVISAGAGGIGAATAALFAEHGASVVVADIDRDRADQVVSSIAAAGGDAISLPADVRVDTEVDQLRAQVLDRFGRVDVLVNNAGHWVRGTRGFVEEDATLWQELHEINFGHVLRMTRAFLPSMVARGQGSIVNVSSVEGLRGYPPGPVYAAYKAAVVQFTRSLAVQVGNDGVRVNGVGPDVTDSYQVPYDRIVPAEQLHLWPQWVPVGRMGVGRDQARAILFLASDLSSFVTGHTIPTDGGTFAAGGWFRTARRGGGWTNRPVEP
jgi:NAD(P)-dependent dehydrogenase (short-subunit alcohol dehydrogenase family)